jgi:hypothetical protein
MYALWCFLNFHSIVIISLSYITKYLCVSRSISASACFCFLLVGVNYVCMFLLSLCLFHVGACQVSYVIRG